MAALFDDFRYYAGHNIALGTLTVLRTNSNFRSGGRAYLPIAQSIEWFPVRRVSPVGSVSGGGRIDVDWLFPVLPRAAVDYLLTTFYGWSGTKAASAPMTIYTPDMADNVWYRMNTYSELIVPRDYDAYRGGDVFVNGVIWRHRRLQAAS